MIELKIDDADILTEPGTTILQAAQQHEIDIPTLCYHPIVEPHGACRLCTVELKTEESSELITACNREVEEGMEVVTDSEEVREARRMVVELLLARCPSVEILQDLAEEYGIDTARFKVRDEDNECILCGLCSRVCEYVVEADAIGYAGRGINAEISTPFDRESEECITCGACAFVCPTDCIEILDEKGEKPLYTDFILGPEKPIAIPTMQAVPNVPAVDTETCIHFETDGCRACESICEPDAIDFGMEEETVDLDVGNIVVATGFDVLDPGEIQQYGYDRFDNVVTGMEFEALCNSTGPTESEILTTEGEEPEAIGVVHCIGSRDKNHNEYCSRVCCMSSLKFSHLITERTDAEVYEFYIDMRPFGKGYEEFYDRVMEEGVNFIRGKVAEVTDIPETENEEGKLILKAEDTLAGGFKRIPVDMVVLNTALEAADDADEVAKTFNISTGKDGFFIEKHPKLDPVATATEGVFIAGACQGPKDIPDTVAQASSAASKILSVVSKGEVEMEAITSHVIEDKCAGCRLCNTLCAYSAIEYNEEKGASEVNEALCKGCGTCAAACPSEAIIAKHYTKEQIMSEIAGVLK